MAEKYLYSEEDADNLCSFLEPMLAADMRKRKHAREMVGHPWLEVVEADGEVGEWWVIVVERGLVDPASDLDPALRSPALLFAFFP
jgi:hypothetical protein